MSLKLFYCYAREDKLLREALGVHLGNLKRQELIVDWHDHNINAGQEWAREVDTHLNAADIILLLISPDFVHSEYCYSIEMKRALQRHENGTARVIPIILRPCDFEGAPFSKLQALPTDGIPVTDRKWRNRDEALFNIVQGVRKTIGELYSIEWTSKGNECLLREQYKEALDAFEYAIYFNPNNASAYVGKGQVFNKLAVNDFSIESSEQALAAFNQAIQLDPLNADAFVGKGIALLDTNVWNGKDSIDLVLEVYAHALSLDPKNENTYIEQGNILMLNSSWEEALAAYEKAISVAVIPNRDVYQKKGDALFHLERYEEAFDAYSVCVKAGLKTEEVYTNIGRVLFNMKRYQEALEAYEKALSLNETSGFLNLEKGDLLHQIEKNEEALQAYTNAIRLIPKHEKSSLAKAYRGKGKIWRLLSQEAFKEADKLDPPKPKKNPFDDLDDDSLGDLDEDSLGDLDTHPF